MHARQPYSSDREAHYCPVALSYDTLRLRDGRVHMKKNNHLWRDLLLIGGLAVFGGLSSVALSRGGPALCHAISVPGGLQGLSGIHVLPLILVAGLVRRPGAATVAGVLKGLAELAAGSSHVWLVLAYAGLAGIVVDLACFLLGSRPRFIGYLLAGGLGTASNVAVSLCAAGVWGACTMNGDVALTAAISFVSGVVLAGWLGWAMLQGLHHAGIVGTGPGRAAVAPAVARVLSDESETPG